MTESDVVILNGALEVPLVKMLRGVGGRHRIVDACAGLSPASNLGGAATGGQSATDPHFWLDPMLVVKYVDNRRAAFSKADPAGADL